MTNPPAPSGKRRRAATAIAVACWLLLLGGGIAALTRHEFTPSPSFAGEARAVRVTMFAHPHCPCTAASVEQLGRIARQVDGSGAEFRIWFFRPESETDAWSQSELWRRARLIPGAQVLMDLGGREAAHWQAGASGHVFVSMAGDVLFSGGITGSRGHEGDNPGASAVIACIGDQTARPSQPVFGCSIAE